MESASESNKTTMRKRLRLLEQRREYESMRDELEHDLRVPDLAPRARFGLIVNPDYTNS